MFFKFIVFVFMVTLTARADDEHFATLKVKDATYTNVTVTTVSATDIYFTHSRGMDNAKLKDLTPDLQKHFHYNAVSAAAVEKTRTAENTQYHQQLLLTPTRKTAAREDAAVTVSADSGDDFVAPKLYARSVRGQPAPVLGVEKWLTDKPDIQGKFVLVDFWATWCGPCRRSIPELNEFYARFKDQLVVIGISDESEADIRKMTDPKIDYYVASDTQARTLRDLAVTGIPHCILVDPHGIVRYEGMPGYLDDAKLKRFLDKYGK